MRGLDDKGFGRMNFGLDSCILLVSDCFFAYLLTLLSPTSLLCIAIILEQALDGVLIPKVEHSTRIIRPHPFLLGPR